MHNSQFIIHNCSLTTNYALCIMHYELKLGFIIEILQLCFVVAPVFADFDVEVEEYLLASVFEENMKILMKEK